MAVWYRWVFYDPQTLQSYTVPINPSSVSEPDMQKTIAEQGVVSPDGTSMIVEGPAKPPKMSFDGTMLTNAHHEAFMSWFSKSNPVQITDDFGNSFWVYITGYTPKRVRAHNQQKRTFTMNVIVLGSEYG